MHILIVCLLALLGEFVHAQPILGTMYGGDGQETFALPDLRGRAPMHQGGNHILAETGGMETVTLTTQQIPAHNHDVNAATVNATSQGSPTNNIFGRHSVLKPYASGSADTTMNAQTMGVAGGSQEHENMPPFLAINYIIALQGTYPSPT